VQSGEKPSPVFRLLGGGLGWLEEGGRRHGKGRKGLLFGGWEGGETEHGRRELEHRWGEGGCVGGTGIHYGEATAEVVRG